MSEDSRMTFLFSLLLLVNSGNSLGSRDGILTTTYSELLTLHENDIKYLHRPLIVTDSPQSDWTLMENLQDLFTPEYTISAEQQNTNCTCLSQTEIYQKGNTELTDLCEHFASALLYKRDSNHYNYWDKYEGKHRFTREGEACISVQDSEMSVHDGIKGLHFIDANPQYSYLDTHHIANDTHRDMISKFRSYFRLFQFRGPLQQIDSVQLDTLDHISLWPFFDLFEMDGFDDVHQLHLWFGTEYYRAIRHYDKSNNIFFVLKGSRNFRLSMPTINEFAMYPFNHASSRHAYPNYPLIEKYREGTHVTENYAVHEVTVYENEMLYIPCYWYHEVENDNVTVAMSIWWDSHDADLGDDMMDIELPIHPIHPDDDQHLDIDEFVIRTDTIDEFLYFVQIMIDRWCAYVYTHPQRDQYSTRCERNHYNGYGFLLDNFVAIWQIVDEITFMNFEWFSMIIDMENILKCVANHVVDYHAIMHFKQHMFLCNDIKFTYKKMWDRSAHQVMRLLMDHTNIGAAEANLVQYLEDILLTVAGDSNILPIWVKMIQL